MSRAERLLDLIQVLRRYRQPVSGQRLADELGVSIRTLYRDIATLQGQGAAIDGEAGLRTRCWERSQITAPAAAIINATANQLSGYQPR